MEKFSQKVFKQIRNVVFGVEDGLISTLGVLTGIASGSNNRAIVILSGFVVVVVESLSMSVGAYLSSKAEKQAEEKLIKEELGEIRKKPAQERKELISFYKERGFEKKEIDLIVKRVMSSEKLLLEEMANKELGIVLKKYENPVKSSVYMFFSYMIGGIVPVVPYFFLPIKSAILISIIFTCIGLFILGYYKGYLTKISKVLSGLEMFAIAAIVALIGYAIGSLVGHVIGLLG